MYILYHIVLDNGLQFPKKAIHLGPEGPSFLANSTKKQKDFSFYFIFLNTCKAKQPNPV